MSNVELWFPVAIYSADNLFSKEQNDIWAAYLLKQRQLTASGGDDWYGGTYTTHLTDYNLIEDPVFAPLVAEITNHVNIFAKMHGSDGVYDCTYGWANIAYAGNFQEFHTHNGSIFSLAYYVAAPEGSGKLVFEDPKEPDMKPLKLINDKNSLSFIKTGYPARQGSLVIFRSYLRHLVEPGTNTTERISISMNFN